MAQDIELKITIPDIEQIKARLKGMPDKANVAMYRSINRTIDVMKGYIVDDVVEKRYRVKKGPAKKSIDVQKASKNRLNGIVKSSTKKPIDLKGFQVTPATSRSMPKVYKSRVMADSKLKELTGNSGRSKAFIATMPNDHVGVFQRRLGVKNGSREKIKELHGPAIPSMLKTIDSSKLVQKRGAEYLKERLNHEINYLLKGT